MDNRSRVVGRLRFPGLRFVIEAGTYGHPWFLRVVAYPGSPWAVDNRTGEPLAWQGRHWRLSEHMTDGEIAQTALKAVLTAIEHEVRERFTYMGIPVFDSHYDLDKLAALREDPDSIKGREIIGPASTEG